MKKLFTFLTIGLLISNSLISRELPSKARNAKQTKRTMAGCNTPTAKTDLDINNVKAKIFAGPDMWY